MSEFPQIFTIAFFRLASHKDSLLRLCQSFLIQLNISLVLIYIGSVRGHHFKLEQKFNCCISRKRFNLESVVQGYMFVRSKVSVNGPEVFICDI